jgi:hypothetical protein
MTTKTEELIQEVTKQTEIWLNLIRGDHHKDRDCHFHIDTIWSYGEPPKYEAWHHGYIINGRFNETYNSYDEALEGLLNFLKIEIKKEEAWQKENNLDDKEYIEL